MSAVKLFKAVEPLASVGIRELLQLPKTTALLLFELMYFSNLLSDCLFRLTSGAREDFPTGVFIHV